MHIFTIFSYLLRADLRNLVKGLIFLALTRQLYITKFTHYKHIPKNRSFCFHLVNMTFNYFIWYRDNNIKNMEKIIFRSGNFFQNVLLPLQQQSFTLNQT